jgi:hypothetical protein
MQIKCGQIAARAGAASPRRRPKARAGAGRSGFARLRPLLAALIILAAAALVSELTRPYRPDNPVDDFIDRSIGRDWAERELDTAETGDVSYECVEMPAVHILASDSISSNPTCGSIACLRRVRAA